MRACRDDGAANDHYGDDRAADKDNGAPHHRCI